MKKAYLLGAGALTLIVAAAAIAVPAMHGRPKADADGNGVISKAEAMTLAEARFAKMDANSDGKISPEDREARTKNRFAEMDADKNGVISEAEFSTAHAARMEKRGGRGEGRMERGGHRGRHGGKGGGHDMALLSKADTNGDRILTREEHRAGAEARFAAADSNKDGNLTATERKAARADRRATTKPAG